MKQFDDDIRWALRRKDPPAGFAERVLARAGATGAPSTAVTAAAKPSAKTPFLFWAAAAVLALAVTGFQYLAVQRARDEQVRGEAAKEQVVQALRIAGSKLQVVQEAIR